MPMVSFQMSEGERDALRAAAVQAGLSISEYIRRAVLGGAVAPAGKAIVRPDLTEEQRAAFRKSGFNV